MAVNALGATTTPPTATTDNSTKQLADTFDTFLKLLTAQLQNQDPLSPMDSAKFTEQLVQYSQVEQQIASNSKLDGLAAQLKASAAGSALSYLGATALFDSNAAAFVNGQADWQYAVDTGAATTTLTVTDAKGNTVYTADGSAASGSHAFQWDGSITGSDQKASPGTYYLAASSKDGTGKTIDTAIAVQEKITGVDFSGTSPTVSTAAGSRAIDKILRVNEASGS
ncbi:MAG: flagellar hook capping FlgD N-terminal domain-containing protein [Alphaproteobacteria bacterium]